MAILSIKIPKKKKKKGVKIKIPETKTTLPRVPPAQQVGGVRITPPPEPEPKLPATVPTHFGQGTRTTLPTGTQQYENRFAHLTPEQRFQIALAKQLETERAEEPAPFGGSSEPTEPNQISVQDQLREEAKTAIPSRLKAIESELKKLGTTPLFSRTTGAKGAEIKEQLLGEDVKQQLKVEQIGAAALAEEKVAARGTEFGTELAGVEALRKPEAGIAPTGINQQGLIAGTPLIPSYAWSLENTQDVLLGAATGGGLALVGALTVATIATAPVSVPILLAITAITAAVRGYQLFRDEIKELDQGNVMISDRYRQTTKESLRELIAQAHAGEEPQEILQSAEEAVSMFRQAIFKLEELAKTKAGASRSQALDKLAEMRFFEEVQLNNYLSELQEAIVNPEWEKAKIYYELRGRLNVNQLTTDIKAGLAKEEKTLGIL